VREREKARKREREKERGREREGGRERETARERERERETGKIAGHDSIAHVLQRATYLRNTAEHILQ